MVTVVACIYGVGTGEGLAKYWYTACDTCAIGSHAHGRIIVHRYASAGSAAEATEEKRHGKNKSQPITECAQWRAALLIASPQEPTTLTPRSAGFGRTNLLNKLWRKVSVLLLVNNVPCTVDGERPRMLQFAHRWIVLMMELTSIPRLCEVNDVH